MLESSLLHVHDYGDLPSPTTPLESGLYGKDEKVSDSSHAVQQADEFFHTLTANGLQVD